MTHLSIPLYRLLRWVKIQRKSGSILLDNQQHSSEWFLEFMYSGISVHFIENRGERIYVVVKNSYYNTIFRGMLHYLHYQYADMENKDIEEYNLIIAELKKKYGKEIMGIKFEKLKKDNLYDKVKVAIKWVECRMKFAFDELGKIDINTFGRKRKFESMLDDL